MAHNMSKTRYPPCEPVKGTLRRMKEKHMEETLIATTEDIEHEVATGALFSDH